MWDNVQFLFVFVGKVDTFNKTFLFPWLFVQRNMQLTKTIIQRSAEAPQPTLHYLCYLKKFLFERRILIIREI